MASIKCKECGSETELVRSKVAEGMRTDYLCRKCNIAWYIDNDGRFRIRLSTTNTLASKLNEEEFEKMIEIVKKHTQPTKEEEGISFTQKIRKVRSYFGGK